MLFNHLHIIYSTYQTTLPCDWNTHVVLLLALIILRIDRILFQKSRAFLCSHYNVTYCLQCIKIASCHKFGKQKVNGSHWWPWTMFFKKSHPVLQSTSNYHLLQSSIQYIIPLDTLLLWSSIQYTNPLDTLWLQSSILYTSPIDTFLLWSSIQYTNPLDTLLLHPVHQFPLTPSYSRVPSSTPVPLDTLLQ